jgi:pimeloyl-ACP methyl ester carboxylesterase
MPHISTPSGRPNMSTLPNPLGGERRFYAWRGWQVAYVVRGHGAPLVFIHSIHAAAWSAEWRQNVPVLAEQHTCYAIDLLGFGASDRPPIHYTAPLYLDLIHDFLRDVVGEPSLLVGSSLGATYAVAIADTHPELVRAVLAVGPAGVSRLVNYGGAPGTLVQGLFRTPVVGKVLFGALVSRASIRFFLKDIYAFGLDRTAEELYWLSANQPNSRYAPSAFVGMRLNHDIRGAIGRLQCPLAIAWGTEASQTPYREAKTVLAAAPSAEFMPFNAGDLPHEEAPLDFNTAITVFADRLAATV